MTKSESQKLHACSEDFPKEFEIQATDNIEVKETKPFIAETRAARDFSAIFSRLKKSARKKAASIL